MSPSWQDAAPETHCRHCGTRVYPTDAKCMGCGRRITRDGAQPGHASSAEEGPPPVTSAAAAAVAAVGRAAAPPVSSDTAPQSRTLEGTPALQVDCVRVGCNGRVRVPTKMGGEGTVYCPLCRKAYKYVLGRVIASPEYESLGKGGLRRWHLRYLPLDPAPEAAAVSFMGPAELQVQKGDEFVFMHLRDDPEQNVLRNVTLGGDYRVQSAPGCFPVLTVLGLAVAIAPMLLRVIGR